jgi:hypothetical protein
MKSGRSGKRMKEKDCNGYNNDNNKQIIKIVFGKYAIKGNSDHWSKWSASEGGVVRWS